MKTIIKIIISLFIIFNIVTIYSVRAQGLSNDTNPKTYLIEFDVLIYPNPVTDNKFYVKSNDLIKTVEVLNVLGQRIRTVHNETNVPYNIFVELGNVKKGMYMVRITFADKKSVIRKIIVK
jgi:hypothetical protein